MCVCVLHHFWAAKANNSKESVRSYPISLVSEQTKKQNTQMKTNLTVFSLFGHANLRLVNVKRRQIQTTIED